MSWLRLDCSGLGSRLFFPLVLGKPGGMIISIQRLYFPGFPDFTAPRGNEYWWPWTICLRLVFFFQSWGSVGG